MSELGMLRLLAIVKYSLMRKRCADLREEAIRRICGEGLINKKRLARIRSRELNVGYERWKRVK